MSSLLQKIYDFLKINGSCIDHYIVPIYNRKIKPDNVDSDYMYVQNKTAKANVKKSALLKLLVLCILKL